MARNPLDVLVDDIASSLTVYGLDLAYAHARTGGTIHLVVTGYDSPMKFVTVRLINYEVLDSISTAHVEQRWSDRRRGPRTTNYTARDFVGTPTGDVLAELIATTSYI